MVRRLKKNRRGIAAVEMALVLPLLLLLTMGAVRYGWLFLKAQQITNATRQAARLKVLPGVTDAKVNDAIEILMAAAGMPQASSSYWVIYTPGDLSGVGLDAETITVTITVPRANIDIMDMALLPAPEYLGAKVTMA
ncbi:MAG: TadE/TadG family type IV pilus assembly protein, partial [Planctomycetota bacterium]